MRRFFLILLLLGTGAQAGAGGEDVVVGDFSHGEIAGWEEKIFAGRTDYAIESLDQQRVLAARTRGAASGYLRKIRVDLRHTPFLNWSWRVDSLYAGDDERSRQGDDFSARLYLVVSGGVLFWRTRALNFVWSSNQAVGQVWPNPFTGNAMMVAVDSGAEGLGQWREHSVDIRKALIQYFDKDFDAIDAVAVMTDADNFGGRAQAFYGDIYFSDQ